MKLPAGKDATSVFVRRAAIALRRAPDWLVARTLFATLAVLSRLPADRAIAVADRLARRIGPLTWRHRLVRANLENAFPELGAPEREAIARDMWGNMSRLVAEYVFLDRLFDFDPQADRPGRVEVRGIPIFRDLLDNPRPFIVFTAHTGNFELLPIAAATFGLDVTALFRPPNNPYVAERLLAARTMRSGHLVPSRAGAAWHLARALEAGRGVGVLVDQKFRKGTPSRFFGRPVKTNPLVAKLVRQYGCEVFPARSIRLPDGRFRLEIEPAIAIPRNADGHVDVAATAQVLNDKVEAWVREYPGQWQWFHDRWQIKKTL